MNICYCHYRLLLRFEYPLTFYQPLPFILRSALGKELKYLSCVLKNQQCAECPLRFKCAYSVVFETPIDKNSQYLKGRNHATPPYAFKLEHESQMDGDTISIGFTLIGKGCEYAPYVMLALARAGENGLFKERVKYTIEDAECNGHTLELSTASHPLETFTLCESDTRIYKNLVLNFKSPFRFKKQGTYSSDISLQDILTSIVRRINLLSGFYGDGAQTVLPTDDCEMGTELRWCEDSRYSARQKETMKLGGVVGKCTIDGEISEHTLSLLKAAELFNIGKNISFGLGYITITEVP